MIIINKLSGEVAIDYAATELKKYLRMMMPDTVVRIPPTPEASGGIRLGLMGELGLDISDVSDPELDDVIYINCDTEGGVIAGSNPRSVLIAVYEYLRRNGCRWLFPGVDGEYIPLRNIEPVSYRHKAASRVRGNCIEGVTSQQTLLDFVEFMPKVGLNTFMIQFRIPHIFYSRYYGHKANKNEKNPEDISIDQSLQWSTEIECELERRGLILHSYGHGFTTDPFGIDSARAWEELHIEPSPDVMRNFAEIGGKRAFFKNKPLNTQLCMSNRETVDRVKSYVVDYARKHENIDYLHIWLADGSNNHCECAECVKMRPSDFYVKIMNEVDEALDEAGLDTRIVVIVYVDTFWAPEVEKLNTGKRFTLMFAPITRDYTKGYNKDAPLPPLCPFERNKLVMPKGFEENIAYYKEWQKSFDGDRFVFEYHFWRHQNYDISGRMLAERIYDDIKGYRELGEDGIIECGSQRSFFPNGYAFYTHARALFDDSLSLEEIEEDYYSTAYGDAAQKMRELLEKMRVTLDYSYVASDQAQSRPEGYSVEGYQEKLLGARLIAEEMRAAVKENYNSDYRIRTASIRILEHWCNYVTALTYYLEKLAERDERGATLALRELERVATPIEDYSENCFDLNQSLSRIEALSWVIKQK